MVTGSTITERRPLLRKRRPRIAADMHSPAGRTVSVTSSVATSATAPLQARVDFVRLDDGSFALMELEAVEPSLYFRTHPAAAGKFADALARWCRRGEP